MTAPRAERLASTGRSSGAVLSGSTFVLDLEAPQLYRCPRARPTEPALLARVITCLRVTCHQLPRPALIFSARGLAWQPKMDATSERRSLAAAPKGLIASASNRAGGQN